VILFLKAGSAFQTVIQRQGDFEDLFAKAMNLNNNQHQTFDITQGHWPDPRRSPRGVVIMGSHHMVTENLPWMEEAALRLRQLVAEAIPVLGICFGHQLLARAFGGIVNNNPKGLEIGTVDIQMTPAAAPDPLFGILPAQFKANVTHLQSVLKLPKNATRLAASGADDCQAFRVGASAWGAQFHPEFDDEVMSLYIEGRKPELEEAGLDTEALQSGVAQVPSSAQILVQFAKICGVDNSS